jgi:hypothetical protein
MSREESLRRPGFVPGTAIRMADGRWWTLPHPSGMGPEEGCDPVDPLLMAHVTAICESQSDVERLRAELGLAVNLLRRNYELEPSDLLEILDCGRDDGLLSAMQEAFHEVACSYVAACRPVRHGPPARDTARTSPLSRFWREFLHAPPRAEPREG